MEDTNVQTDAEAGGETPELCEAVMPEGVLEGDDTAARPPQDIMPEGGDLDDSGDEVEGVHYVINTDGVRYAVGDKVKIAEIFPAYRGAEGVISAVRKDPVGGDFFVADVELTNVKQAGTNEPVWFNNVALSQIEKVD
jgi:hypothetical protein